jgi:hypothetical protein
MAADANGIWKIDDGCGGSDNRNKNDEAAHLPAARDVFRRSCAEIKEGYDGFLALHPVNP